MVIRKKDKKNELLQLLENKYDSKVAAILNPDGTITDEQFFSGDKIMMIEFNGMDDKIKEKFLRLLKIFYFRGCKAILD